MAAAVDRVKEIALAVATVQDDCGLRGANLSPGDFVEATLNAELAEVVHEWAAGAPFMALTRITETQEGSIVRVMTRVDECCREVRSIARVIGDPVLFRKMDAASAAVRRGVIFCASLYLQ